MTSLASALQAVRQRIQRAAKKPLNEQNTKATLIELVLPRRRTDRRGWGSLGEGPLHRELA